MRNAPGFAALDREPDRTGVAFVREPVAEPRGVREQPAVPRTFVYAETFRPNFRPIAGSPRPGYRAEYHHRAVRNSRYKLIEWVRPSGTKQEMYSLFNPRPTAPPVPQDPALTRDPHELRDLMLSQGSWFPEIQNAYDELVAELAANHPALPVGHGEYQGFTKRSAAASEFRTR